MMCTSVQTIEFPPSSTIPQPRGGGSSMGVETMMGRPCYSPRRLCYVLLTCGVGYLLISGFPSHPWTQEISEAESRGVSLLARTACQFLEEGIGGDEGSAEQSGFKLKGLVLVFRHGERMPILSRDTAGDPIEVGEAKGEVDGDCSPFHEEHRRQFDVYRRRVESEEFDYFLRPDPAFKGFKRMPHPSRCSYGNMTAEGALQLVRLGGFLSKRYGVTSLFKEVNATLHATKYPRTFQSAVAFSTAFFFNRNITFPQMFIREHVAWFSKRGDIDTRAGAQLAIEAMQIPAAKDPLAVVDVLLGYYICRREPLPCDPSGHCIKYRFFDEVLNATTHQSERMVKDSKSILRRLTAAEAQPILGYLAAAIARIRHMPHTHLIRVYSGHDTTVGPLLRAMGIPAVDPPHYAARLAFEIYSSESTTSVSEALFVRVLYDGFDRTVDVRFCPEHKLVEGLCPAKYFEEFAKTGLFDWAGYRNREELCDV